MIAQRLQWCPEPRGGRLAPLWLSFETGASRPPPDEEKASNRTSFLQFNRDQFNCSHQIGAKPLVPTLSRQLVSEFFTANFFQCREIVLRQLPHKRRSPAFVIMAQHIADARHFRPRDFGMTLFNLRRETPAGLGYNLDAALDKPLKAPITLEGFKANIRDYDANAFARLNNVRQIWNE
jgi:hypothetical protein